MMLHTVYPTTLQNLFKLGKVNRDKAKRLLASNEHV